MKNNGQVRLLMGLVVVLGVLLAVTLMRRPDSPGYARLLRGGNYAVSQAVLPGASLDSPPQSISGNKSLNDEDYLREVDSVDVLLANRLWNQAEGFLQKLRQKYPGSSPLDLRWAQLCLETGRFRTAEKTLERILERDPGVPTAWYLTGLLAWEQGRWSRAVRNWERTLELSQAFPQLEGWLPEARRRAGMTP